MGLLTMDDGIVNWGEHTEDEKTNHALMAISSSSEGPQEPEPSVSDDRSSECSTCQSNDSAGSIGTSSVHFVDSESKISSVPPEVYVSTPITTNEKGGQKLVWTNANRVNHANQFVPRSVQLNAGRPNINSVRPNVNTGRVNVNSVRPNVNTGRTNVNPVRPRVNTGSSNVNTVRSRQPVPTKTSNSFSPKRPQVNQLNQRRHFSKSHSPVSRPIVRNTARMTYSHAVKENWGSAVKTSAGYNWRNSKPHSNCDSGPTSFRTVNAKGPQGRPKPVKAWWTHASNKDQLEIEEFMGESVYPLEVAKATYLAIFLKFKERGDLDRTLTREEGFFTDTSEDNPKILAFSRELEEIALKHLGKTEKHLYHTPSV
ncbi:hypothetical protein Tco_0799487 [Tanacetum coccineum]|uniref:Uncharacterized protein n=1 Tax=Tanacetum coccineum TaxID=301880 RepID=A0ABQ4ZQF5_9ASTR